MGTIMKRKFILVVCLLLLFFTAACSAELPEDSSLSSTVDDVFSETEDALAPEAEESALEADVPSIVAKEGGAVLIYNGEVAAEGCPEALAAVAERMGLDVLYFDSADTLSEQLGDAALCMIGGTEDDLDPLVS